MAAGTAKCGLARRSRVAAGADLPGWSPARRLGILVEINFFFLEKPAFLQNAIHEVDCILIVLRMNPDEMPFIAFEPEGTGWRGHVGPLKEDEILPFPGLDIIGLQNRMQSGSELLVRSDHAELDQQLVTSVTGPDLVLVHVSPCLIQEPRRALSRRQFLAWQSVPSDTRQNPKHATKGEAGKCSYEPKKGRHSKGSNGLGMSEWPWILGEREPTESDRQEKSDDESEEWQLPYHVESFMLGKTGAFSDPGPHQDSTRQSPSLRLWHSPRPSCC